MTTNNQLQAIVNRIEKLEEEKAELANDVREIYLEAKATGFDPKIIKRIISIRKKDAQKVKEEEALIATYMQALGMLSDTPLGQASIKAATKAPSPTEDDLDDDDFE